MVEVGRLQNKVGNESSVDGGRRKGRGIEGIGDRVVGNTTSTETDPVLVIGFAINDVVGEEDLGRQRCVVFPVCGSLTDFNCSHT